MLQGTNLDTLVLLEIQPKVYEVFQLLGFSQFFNIKDNLDEALCIDHATAIDREADRLLKARTTADHKEAVKAFAEKREPVFTGC